MRGRFINDQTISVEAQHRNMAGTRDYASILGLGIVLPPLVEIVPSQQDWPCRSSGIVSATVKTDTIDSQLCLSWCCLPSAVDSKALSTIIGEPI